jgi:hypothetical protein
MAAPHTAAFWSGSGYCQDNEFKVCPRVYLAYRCRFTNVSREVDIREWCTVSRLRWLQLAACGGHGPTHPCLLASGHMPGTCQSDWGLCRHCMQALPACGSADSMDNPLVY